MIKRILVPTDGSELSERAFPIAAAIAKAQDAEIVLVRVLLPVLWFGEDRYVSPQSYEDIMRGITQDVNDYLVRAATHLRETGVKVRTEVLNGSPGATLLDFEVRNHVELVVMSTHGRTGLARFAVGSLADLILREGAAPVLLVRAFGSLPGKFETALIPLDGSSLAEEALPMAEQLAGKPLSRFHLLRVISEPNEREAAANYLARIATPKRPGVEVTVAVEEDVPSQAIARAAAGFDLIILSTHGRGGFDRLRHGSVADEATRHLGVPTLLVRAGVTPASRGSVEANVGAAG